MVSILCHHLLVRHVIKIVQISASEEGKFERHQHVCKWNSKFDLDHGNNFFMNNHKELQKWYTWLHLGVIWCKENTQKANY